MKKLIDTWLAAISSDPDTWPSFLFMLSQHF